MLSGRSTSERLTELVLVGVVVIIIAVGILYAAAASRKRAADSQIRNDVRQLRLLAEQVRTVQGDTYKHWATHETVRADVQRILADIDKHLQDEDPATFQAHVRSSQNNYFCISAPLRTSAKHFCVDAGGAPADVSGPCPPEPLTVPLACPP